MKTLKFFAFAFLAICIAACSGGGGKVVPSSKKINGPLGKFFEVVERDYKFVDGVINVEIKRIEEGGPNDASWSSRPTFTLELLDEDGDVMSSVSTDVVFTKEQLEAVFALGIDETTSISFNVDEVKEAAKFKISSKWDEAKEGESESSSAAASTGTDGTFDLHGTVDKYPITMHLNIDGTTVKGSYYYDKKGPNAKLSLSGTNDDGELDINETDADGTPTGHFKGKLDNGVFRGQFITNKGKKMPFIVSEGDIDVSDNDDSEYDDSDTSSSGSEDWDELLDSYENYVDKYISYMKKAAKGDMTALAEYPSLMEKAQDYSDKLQKAQGEMSTSQWARYNKITMKMAKAAQEMQ